MSWTEPGHTASNGRGSTGSEQRETSHESQGIAGDCGTDGGDDGCGYLFGRGAGESGGRSGTGGDGGGELHDAAEGRGGRGSGRSAAGRRPLHAVRPHGRGVRQAARRSARRTARG